ncbi:RagB/SusD family nutrient uptake outer membrane protein [Marinilabiliaceae bacterium JC017]|nr:RagB/SusD family nutrient uptake outer membrane protein [Marinilabiliaceae bacterium JC017]
MKMKKNILLFTLLLFSGLTLFTGCDDFLDVAPDERLEINSLKNIEATLVGAYQNDRGYRFTHMCTDNVTLATNVYNNEPIIEDLYTWSRDFRNQTHQDSPSAYWIAAYNSISNANHALEALDNISIAEADKSKAAALKGEAMICRAYQHFVLVNLFGKHYDPQTASSDPGIPYTRVPENQLIVDYKRYSVEEVYSMAEEDMLKGIELFVANIGETSKNKYRFTLPSVYTFASRFYTYRNKNEEDVVKAIEYANKAIEAFGGVEVMRPWSDYKNDAFGPIDIDQSEVGMVQRSYTWLSFNWTYQMTIGINKSYLSNNPFDKTDERLISAFIRDGDIFIPSRFFVYDPSDIEASASDIFPIAEAIINAAEGYIRKGEYTEATNMLNVIGGNVYRSYNPSDLSSENLLAFYETTNEQEAWTKYLLFERRNMFLMRGYRWFDIKRYHLDVEHLLEDGSTVKLSEIAPNMDFQIPNFAISTGMEPNK